jgi:excisionase family DNA binding protein
MAKSTANGISLRDRDAVAHGGVPARPAANLWTVADLARFLGVPVNTIYKWRTSGDGPPAYRVGKHLRFDEGQVREWLRTRRDPC